MKLTVLGPHTMGNGVLSVRWDGLAGSYATGSSMLTLKLRGQERTPIHTLR